MAGASGGVRIKWHDRTLVRNVEWAMSRRLENIGAWLASKVRRNISTSTRSAGPSEPGEYPHADTGTLRKSVTFQLVENDFKVLVGTAVVYAARLEYDLDRSFLNRTLVENFPEIKKRLTSQFDKGDFSVTLELYYPDEGE